MSKQAKKKHLLIVTSSQHLLVVAHWCLKRLCALKTSAHLSFCAQNKNLLVVTTSHYLLAIPPREQTPTFRGIKRIPSPLRTESKHLLVTPQATSLYQRNRFEVTTRGHELVGIPVPEGIPRTLPRTHNPTVVGFSLPEAHLLTITSLKTRTYICIIPQVGSLYQRDCFGLTLCGHELVKRIPRALLRTKNAIVVVFFVSRSASPRRYALKTRKHLSFLRSAHLGSLLGTMNLSGA